MKTLTAVFPAPLLPPVTELLAPEPAASGTSPKPLTTER
jgi:hypothetical protein